ncbi:MAG: lipopolysaccharide biosynthesis protein [Bifidobacteriaceae bacterium]|nr:lipopolysaccharide biosynthesis protein [Bifidobacteriaceae bacterium]
MAGTLEHGARGGGVTMAGQAVKLALHFGGLVALSRLLTPRDFGIVAMITVFISLAEMLRDFGLPTAVLQAPRMTHQQSSNLFWLNTAMGATAWIILAVSAPLLVAIYDEPKLRSVVPVLAAMVLLNGAQAQIQVGLAKQMRFSLLVVTDLSGSVLGLSTAIATAAAGAGCWALVAQYLVNATVVLSSRWILSRWRPARPKRGEGTGPLIRTGANFGLAQLLSWGTSNIDTMMIGARFGSVRLGYYSRAYSLLMTPLSQVVGPLYQVVVPTLRRAEHEGRTHEDVLERVQRVMGVAVNWVFMVAGATAPALIPLLLGDQWGHSIGLFQIFSLGGFFSVLSQVNYWAYVSDNQSGALLRFNLVTKTITMAAIVGCAFISVNAVAWAVTVCLALNWPAGLWWGHRAFGLKIRVLLTSGLRVVIAALASFGVTALTVRAMVGDAPDVVVVLVGAALATAVYLAACLGVPGGVTWSKGVALDARRILKSWTRLGRTPAA